MGCSPHRIFENKTHGVFTVCEKPRREPDYVSKQSGSKYWISGDNIIRESNHWCKIMTITVAYDGIAMDTQVVRQCTSIKGSQWHLLDLDFPSNVEDLLKLNLSVTGKARLKDFKKI